jgi:hypothetical protein
VKINVRETEGAIRNVHYKERSNNNHIQGKWYIVVISVFISHKTIFGSSFPAVACRRVHFLFVLVCV